MSRTRTYTVALTAGAEQVLPGGRFLFILSATAALDIELTDANGTPSDINGVGAGSRMRRLNGEPWRYTKLLSATSQTVIIVLSDDAEFDVASAVTVTGGVQTTEIPSTALADTPAVALPNATTTPIVAANLARKRVTISNPSTAAGSFFIRNALAATNNLFEIQPGQSAEFKTTAGLWGRNDSGGALSALVLEET